jgi:hypothetical protein
LADRRGRQIRQQLRQVTLRIDGMPAAATGQAGKDRSRLAASNNFAQAGAFRMIWMGSWPLPQSNFSPLID